MGELISLEAFKLRRFAERMKPKIKQVVQPKKKAVKRRKLRKKKLPTEFVARAVIVDDTRMFLCPACRSGPHSIVELRQHLKNH